MENLISLAWHGLPAYAARLIAASPGGFPIIATKPSVPIAGMDKLLPNRIHWITENYFGGWAGLGLRVPSLYFQPSWCTPSFNNLGKEVHAKGGKIVVMFDNPWRGDFRQLIGAIRFHTQWRNRFCAAWVVGESGARLARYWGFAESNIYTGMYGADPNLFRALLSPPLASRPKRFIFVGQLIPRKGIHELLIAWRLFSQSKQEWELHIYGTGPLEYLVRESNVVFRGFQQPDVIAAAMQQSRFLILPSHEEHWGLVVCEAAQSGCGFILSDAVASHLDLLTPENGRLFKSKDIYELRDAMKWAADCDAPQLDVIASTSQAKGIQFTPQRFADTFSSIMAKHL